MDKTVLYNIPIAIVMLIAMSFQNWPLFGLLCILAYYLDKKYRKTEKISKKVQRQRYKNDLILIGIIVLITIVIIGMFMIFA